MPRPIDETDEDRIDGPYTEAQLANLLPPLRRAAPDVAIDLRALQTDLRDLLIATGTISADEFGLFFNELARQQPEPKLLLKCFKMLATRRTVPLCSVHPNIGRQLSRIVQSNLHAQLRSHHRHRLRELEVRFDNQKWRLTISGFEDDPEIVHQAAAHLADYHKRNLRRGRKPEAALDTLLLECARIFVEITAKEIDPIALPHGDRSDFIRFAHAALSPFFIGGEAERNPLAQRWQKLKTASQEFCPAG